MILVSDRSYSFNLIENYKVSRETPEQFGIKITEDDLSFFVDAYFDKSDRKWFWGNENEIQADQWAYQCSNQPHQPATDLVVTIKFDEISKYFLEIVNRCSSEGDVSTETDEFGNTLKCCNDPACSPPKAIRILNLCSRNVSTIASPPK